MKNNTFESLYAELKQQLSTLDRDNTLMVGIHTGGYWLAEQLHAELGFKQPLYAVSTTLQRDDFASSGLHKQNLPSRLPLNLQGAPVLLVDDVLFTGRSIRAAINELFEFGRPATIKLAVLAMREGRQLPISADFSGGTVQVPAGQRLALSKDETGKLALNLMDNK